VTRHARKLASAIAAHPDTIQIEPVAALCVRVLWWSTIVIAGGYFLLWVRLQNLPFLDFPNHLARSVVMADALFDHGLRFGQAFTVKLSLSTYVLGDLALASLVEAFGPSRAGPLWAALVFLSLPVSVAYFARSLSLSPLASASALLIGCYLGSSWFFLAGFFSFQLAVSLSLIVGASLIRQCESPSWSRLAAIIAVTTLGYFIHITTVLFVCLLCVVVAIAYPAPLRRRAVATGVPLLVAGALLIWGVLDPAAATHGGSDWGGFAAKARRLVSPFVRFGLRSEALCALPLVLVAWLGFRQWRKLPGNGRAVLCAVMIGAFLTLYWVLPISQGRGYDVDVRALSPMYASIVLLILLAIDRGSQRLQITAWAASACLALVNLWYLHDELAPLDRTIAVYRSLLQVVPDRSTLLPVSAVPNIGRHQAFLHAGSWATIDRGAITPYIFSGSTGEAMSYFRYVNTPQAPSIFWAVRPGYPSPDCAQVTRDFAYVSIIGRATLACPGFIIVARSKDPEISILKRAAPAKGDGGT
jgi:hypothetical protein